jgi:hypothetical protein
MSAAPMSRRGALRLGVLGVAALIGISGAQRVEARVDGFTLKVDKKELLQDVEALKYDDEVLEVGPDAEEGMINRQKPKKKENVAVAKEEEREEREEAEYDAVVAKEAEEGARLKAEFDAEFAAKQAKNN